MCETWRWVRVPLGAWHSSSTDFNPKNNCLNPAPLQESKIMYVISYALVPTPLYHRFKFYQLRKREIGTQRCIDTVYCFPGVQELGQSDRERDRPGSWSPLWCHSGTKFFPQIIKGTVSRDWYFFEGLKILIITFCVSADGFQGLSKAFHYPIQ